MSRSNDTDRRVVVTGIGVICGGAADKDEYYKNCAGGKPGIVKCGLFPTEKLTTDYFGEIDPCFNLPDFETSPLEETRIKKMMKIAAAETLRDSGLDRSKIGEYGTEAVLCFGTLLAAADGIMKYASVKKNGGDHMGMLEHIYDFLPYIRDIFGIKGGSYVCSSACAAGTTSVGMAFDFIKNGVCKICVVGGADPLTKVSAYGFHALKSLSNGICNPYDENRDGINIGEGAAFFICEELESAKRRGVRIYGEIMGYGLTNDAYHITSPDPEGCGVAEAMKVAVSEANLNPGDISHINGHGTGTPVNDRMEMKALSVFFGGTERIPPLNSTKALIGHCMGASGALETALLLLAIENQVYIPLPNLSNPISGDMLFNEAMPCEIKYALKNSFAFAGNIASVVIGRYDGI